MEHMDEIKIVRNKVVKRKEVSCQLGNLTNKIESKNKELNKCIA